MAAISTDDVRDDELLGRALLAVTRVLDERHAPDYAHVAEAAVEALHDLWAVAAAHRIDPRLLPIAPCVLEALRAAQSLRDSAGVP